MARINNLDNFLTDVASAIKTKKGSQTAIPAANFDTEILNLPSQGTYQTKTVTLSENNTVTISPDTGYDGMTQINITTDAGAVEQAANLVLSQEILDPPYVELEYMDSPSDRTLSIDLGIHPEHHQVQCKMQMLSKVTNTFLWGCGYFHLGYYPNYGGYYGEMFTACWASSGNEVCVNADPGLANEYIFNSDRKLIVNGTVMRSDFINPTSSQVASETVRIFGRGWYTPWRSHSRMYYFKLIDNNTGEVLFDIIPVKRKSDNVVCAFDKISQTFLTAQGSGVFTAGPVKS